MGQAARPLSDRGALPARGGVSLASSPAVLEKVSAEPIRSSAEIVRAPIPCLPKLRETVRKDAAALFWRTFEGDSLNAKAIDAARKIPGASPDTFARLYDEETVKVEHALITAMLYWRQQRFGALPPLPGLVARAQHGAST